MLCAFKELVTEYYSNAPFPVIVVNDMVEISINTISMNNGYWKRKVLDAFNFGKNRSAMYIYLIGPILILNSTAIQL